MDDFFRILTGTETSEGTWSYTVSINPEHDIFKGHFPGRPVVPGVMTLMLTRKCAEHAKGLGKTRICSVKDAKYISPITPDGVDVVITFSIDESLNIKAEVRSADGRDYTKIRMTLAQE
ncbi:MAG: hypothetical protein MR215_10120 [Bacteroidales bacterium]|nr:hypothetical protein [Bacteroidales bacterium]